MLQVGDAPRLVKEAPQSLLVELVETQHLECQDTAKGCRFAHLIDMTIASCTNEGNNFINAYMCSLHQEVAAGTAHSISGVLMSPAGACIQTTGQRLYLFPRQKSYLGTQALSVFAANLPTDIYAHIRR